VRDARAPLDAVPRVAATWEVTGSLTFVTDKPSATELPFDDRLTISSGAVKLRGINAHLIAKSELRIGQSLSYHQSDSAIQHTLQGLKPSDGMLTSPVSKIWKLL